MLVRSLALAACVVPLLNLPTEAAAFSAVWTGNAPAFITVAHHHHSDFDDHDARQLARSMGYHGVDVNEVRHGFIVTGFNQDGKWRLFIDNDGNVGSVTQIDGGHHHGDHGDDD